MSNCAEAFVFFLYWNSGGRSVMLRCLRRDQIKLLWLRGWVLKTEEHSVVWLLNFCTGMSKPLIAGECLSSTPPSFHSHIPHWSYITEKLLPPKCWAAHRRVSESHIMLRICWTFKRLLDVFRSNVSYTQHQHIHCWRVQFWKEKSEI